MSEHGGREDPAPPAPPSAPGGQAPPSFLRSMPAPLMALFALLVAGAVVLALWLIVRPPTFPTTPIAQRRPPPASGLTHGVGGLTPAPAPPTPAPYTAPCEAFASVRIRGGPGAVARLTDVLRRLCPLTQGGVDADLVTALDRLDGATLGFGLFPRTGVESTAQTATRTIWLNVKFAATASPRDVIAPLLVHEAWHLGAPEPPDAVQEYRARRAELAACRELIKRDDWPRACRDAESIVAGGEARAVAALRGAGYR